MTSKRGVFFDVDGTLSDSSKLGFDSTVAVLKQNGLPTITQDEYHQGTRYSTPQRFAWHATGNTDDPCGVKLGKEFDDMYVALVSIETTPFYAGITELLDSVLDVHRDVVYGALSNACGAYVQRVLCCNGVASMFPVALGADDVPKPKPHPDGLLQCCRTLSIDPVRCVYVGDSPSDGLAASAAGIKSIGVTWGSHPADSVREAFDVTVDRVEDLKVSILDVLNREC